MDAVNTGTFIRASREARGLTQHALAERLSVSEKTVSKWETGKGFPDITLWAPLAEALSVSLAELFDGCDVTNTNKSFNMLRVKFHVCPLCGNVLLSAGEAVLSCCGVRLEPLSPEEADEAHEPLIERVEDEYFVSFPHEMTKAHYLSFAAAVRDNGVELVKFYPEGAAEARFKIGRARYLFWYCNHHGLFRRRL